MEREVYGQRVYGFSSKTETSDGAAGAAGIGVAGEKGYSVFQDLSKISDGDDSNFADIKSVSGSPGSGLLSGDGGSTITKVELSFQSSLIKDQPIFLKMISYEESGVNKITIQAYSTDTPVGTSKDFESLPRTTKDEAIFSSSGNFNKIVITVETGKGSTFLGLIGNRSYVYLQLFYAYFLDLNCHSAINTSFGSNGLTLDLLGTGPKVLNPFNAIDDDINTKSTLSLGSGVTIGLGSSVYQDVVFTPSSLVGNGIRIYLRSPQSVVNLNLFSGVKVTVYNGTSVVFEKSIDQILGLDLLGLLGGQQLVPIDIYGINSSFDKVRISLGNFLNVGVLSGGIEFNMIQMLPPLPEINSSTANACKGDLLALEVQNPNSSLVYKWYLNGNNIGVGNQLQYPTNALMPSGSPYEFVVRSIVPSCILQESGNSIIRVMVYDKPAKPRLTISDVIN